MHKKGRCEPQHQEGIFVHAQGGARRSLCCGVSQNLRWLPGGPL